MIRLFCEQLEQWVENSVVGNPVEPEVIEELTLRLLAMVVMLLRQYGCTGRALDSHTASLSGDLASVLV